MRKRLFRIMGVLACGCSFQLLGCESQQIGEILVGGIRSAAVDVGTFVVESIVDEALGLE